MRKARFVISELFKNWTNSKTKNKSRAKGTSRQPRGKGRSQTKERTQKLPEKLRKFGRSAAAKSPPRGSRGPVGENLIKLA